MNLQTMLVGDQILLRGKRRQDRRTEEEQKTTAELNDCVNLVVTNTAGNTRGQIGLDDQHMFLSDQINAVMVIHCAGLPPLHDILPWRPIIQVTALCLIIALSIKTWVKKYKRSLRTKIWNRITASVLLSNKRSFEPFCAGSRSVRAHL